MEKIAFFGLGHMGNPMADNLLKAGFDLTIYDISSSAIEALVAKGAKSTSSITETLASSDVIITMLPSGQQVKDICVEPNGIFQNAKKHALFIDCSSIDIATTKALHADSVKHNIAMLDAPVSGGVSGATAGTLTFMVGGAESDFQRAVPILEKMGKKIIHAGQAGSGQAAKICNNLILGMSMIAVCEGFDLAEKLGLNLKTFFDISSNASGQCWSMTSYCPVPGIIEKSPANQEYQPGFMAKMMLKDLLLATNAADSVNAVIPQGKKATELYKQFVEQGYGELDFSGIIKMLGNK